MIKIKEITTSICDICGKENDSLVESYIFHHDKSNDGYWFNYSFELCAECQDKIFEDFKKLIGTYHLKTNVDKINNIKEK